MWLIFCIENLTEVQIYANGLFVYLRELGVRNHKNQIKERF